MVIVTQNQYLLASKIYHITLDESVEYIDYRENGKLCSKRVKKYTIQIIYAPDTPTNNNGRDESRECVVNITSAVDAHKVFRDIVEQIREQNPDQLYLDKALEKMIAATDIDYLTTKDKVDELKKQYTKRARRLFNDRNAEKIRKVRKAKRRSKKVLRRVK